MAIAVPGQDESDSLQLSKEDTAPQVAKTGAASSKAEAEAAVQRAAEEWWASLKPMSTFREKLEKEEASKAEAAEQRAKALRKRRAMWTPNGLEAGASDSDDGESKIKFPKTLNNEFDEGLDEFRPADGATHEELEDFGGITRRGLASREELAAQEDFDDVDLPKNCPVVEFEFGGFVAATSSTEDAAAGEATEVRTGHPTGSELMDANLAQQFQIGMKHAESENERPGLGAV